MFNLEDFYYKGCRCILDPYSIKSKYSIDIGVLHTSVFYDFFRYCQKNKDLIEKITSSTLDKPSNSNQKFNNSKRCWIHLFYETNDCPLDIINFSKKCMDIIDNFPDSNNLKIISTSIKDGKNFYKAVEDFTVGRIGLKIG